jgi:hypothetical protein
MKMIVLEERIEERKEEKRRWQEELCGHCLSWFNNHMTVVLMATQYIHARGGATMQGIDLFLHDIEHHFVSLESSLGAKHAFRYLKRYFQCYPHVSPKHSKRAIEMVRRIYKALGLELNLGPLPVCGEKHKLEEKRKLRIVKILATCLVALKHVLSPHASQKGETHGKF